MGSGVTLTKTRNLGMTRNRFGVARAGVFPKGVFLTLSAQHAPVAARMAEQTLALHPITTNDCSASGGMARQTEPARNRNPDGSPRLAKGSIAPPRT